MRGNRISLLTICAIVLVALVVLSLVPVFALGQYDRMAFDDYYYSKYTRSAVVEGGSLGDVLEAAVETVVVNHNTWQGTYSAVFLFSLQPGIWDQALYAVTPVLLIGTLIAGLGMFLHSLCRTLLGAKKSIWIISWMIATLLCVQFPREANEGFYWYNSAMLYTFFFSLLLLWIGFAVNLTFRKALTGWRLWLRGVLLALFSAVIAGANYPTALLFGIVLVAWVAWSVWKRRDLLAISLLSLLVFAAGFLINTLAPGNAVRQSALVMMSPVQAVIEAIKGTPVRMFGQFFRHPGALALLVLVWALFCVVALRESNRAFRLPLLVPVASWLILAVLFTPPFYAMGYSGPYRLWNIIIFSFYLLLMVNLYYFTGWWKRRFPGQYEKVLNWLLRARRLAPVYLAVVVCASVLLSGVGPALGLERESATSVRATLALMDGTTRRYAEAFDAQAQAVLDAQTDPVEVSAISLPDYLLPEGDLTLYIGVSEEPSLWYGKHLVIAAQGQ